MMRNSFHKEWDCLISRFYPTVFTTNALLYLCCVLCFTYASNISFSIITIWFDSRIRGYKPTGEWNQTSAGVVLSVAVGSTQSARRFCVDCWCSDCRSRFEVCSSGLSRLGAVAARLQAVETLFTAVLPEGQAPAQRQPAVLWTLQYLREEIGRNLTQFTAWKTELLTLKAGSSGEGGMGTALLKCACTVSGGWKLKGLGLIFFYRCLFVCKSLDILLYY